MLPIEAKRCFKSQERETGRIPVSEARELAERNSFGGTAKQSVDERRPRPGVYTVKRGGARSRSAATGATNGWTQATTGCPCAAGIHRRNGSPSRSQLSAPVRDARNSAGLDIEPLAGF